MSEFGGRSPGDPSMTQDGSSPGSAADPSFAEPGVSAGALLRQAREAAGLHIAALAVSLKVPVKKLEALEAGRLDVLPDSVFVRALAASVCRTLKIDAVPVLALLPQTGKPSLGHQRSSINTAFRSPSDGPGPSLWGQISRPAVLAGLLLLLGSLVMIFLPAVQQQDTAAQSAPGSVAAGSVQGNSQSGVLLAGTEVLVGAQPVNRDRPVEQAATFATAPAAAVRPLPAAVPNRASPNLPATSPAAPVPLALAAPTPSSTIVFKAKGESWVEVTDAKGIVVLRRILLAGEAVGASGTLPLTAVVGRADATQVQVRGQAFDLKAVSKDNVARFEVK